MEKIDWLSCYIYIDKNQEIFLRETLLPVVQKSIAKKYTSQFFFIRYADRTGVHIRLRFKGEEKMLEQKLKPYLRTAFQAYTIKFVKYIPEIERYGGNVGILIAEEQFEISSQIVLSLLKETKDWSYERALGTALQLHLGMAYALGMNTEQAIAFFAHIATHEKEKNFQELFSKQDPNIIHSLFFLWQALEKKQIFQENWFNTWLKDMKKIKTQLHKAQEKNELVIQNHQHHENPLWNLYESYLHMNNNRLGIYVEDEAFIGYILNRCLESIYKQDLPK